MDGGNLARPVPEAVVSPWIQVVWKYARRSSMSRPIGISSRILKNASMTSSVGMKARSISLGIQIRVGWLLLQ